MLPRFYIPDVDTASSQFDLPDEEAAHLVRVLRLGEGDEIEVFDGRGGAWKANVIRTDKQSATVRRHAPVESAAEAHVAVSVVISVLKASKMDEIVRDTVMIGASAIQPVTSARSIGNRGTLADGHRIARWQRIAVSSAKQCRRAVVPIVHPVVPFDEYLGQASDALRIICVEPAAANAGLRSADQIPRPETAAVIIGPEGGWTDAEVIAAREAGAIPMTLGSRVLRADAVPLIALTALFSTWGELS
ncbi:MAG: 16S rRNA (uracil(1498)-N(3))-methyltransferase [Vicinamibacterales bacterium]